MWTEQRVKTIKDLYDYAVENSEELLGTWQSSFVDEDFWLPYTLDNEVYDRVFCNKYKNWYYFDQTGDETVAEVFERFVTAITDFLTLNDKRYHELFKVELMSVDSQTILADYTLTKETDSERTIDRDYISGARQDSASETLGSRTDTVTNQVMAFNSSTFADSSKSTDVMGQQLNSSSANKGSQTDNEDVTDTLGSTVTMVGSNTNPYENMQKFIDTWDGYSFYSMIFRNMAAEFLIA